MGIFRDSQQGHGKSGGVGPILFPLTTPNPPILNPQIYGFRPHEKSSQLAAPKETSKVERKELRQLLFDLDQAGRWKGVFFFFKTPCETGLFQRKVDGVWQATWGVLPEVV